MGSGVTTLMNRDKPDQRGQRAFLVGRVKMMIVGEKLNWLVFFFF